MQGATDDGERAGYVGLDLGVWRAWTLHEMKGGALPGIGGTPAIATAEAAARPSVAVVEWK